MKIRKILLFMALLLLPVFTKAVTYTSYDSSLIDVNNYINKYHDRNKYLNFGNPDMPYEFRDGNSYKNDDFKKGGLLSVLEYNTSKKGNSSYLATGREYWTLSKNNSNQYYIDNILLDKNPSENSGIRVTQFVKPSVNVTGKGTYVNPWVFREQFSVAAYSTSATYGTVSPNEQMVDRGNKAALNITPKTGYKYSGSDCNLLHITGNKYDTQLITKDTICNVDFEIRKIKINQSCTGGSGSIASQTVKYNDPYTIADYNQCTRTGYTQTGWKTSDGSTWTPGSYEHMTLENGQRGLVNDTLNLQPVWQANNYTITYYLGNGTNTAGVTSIGTQTCTYDSSCVLKSYSSFGKTLPNSTTPSGACDYQWVFYGWTDTQTGMTKKYGDAESFTYNKEGNMSLYVLESRYLHFNTGVAPTTDTEIRQYWNPYSSSDTYVSAITIPPRTTISGWTFIGYKGGSSAANADVDYGASSPGETVKPLPTTCRFFRSKYSRPLKLTYDVNGATSGTVADLAATQYYNSGYASGGENKNAQVNSPEFTLRSASSLRKTGYSFSKWAAGSKTGNQYAAEGAYSGFGPAVGSTNTTQTMYAIWTANTYTITYNANGGSGAPGATTYTYAASGTVALSSTKPTRTNYAFVGWSTSNNTTTATYSAGDGFNKSTANNTTLYAVWCGVNNYINGKTCTACPSGYTCAYGATSRSTCKIHCNDNYRVNSIDAACSTACATGYSHAAHDVAAGSTSSACTATTYTINYSDYGTHGSSHPTSATYGSTFTVSNPTKSATVTLSIASGISVNYTGSSFTASALTKTNNYTFNGWNITGMDSVTHTYDSSTSTATSLTGVKATSFKNLRSTNGTVTFTGTWGGTSFVFPKITKTGYTCKWTSSGVSDVASGGSWSPTSTGSRTFTATCSANTYSISYSLSSGTHGTYHPTSGTYDANVTISNPTKTATATFVIGSGITCRDGSTACSNNYQKSKDYTFDGWNITGMDTVTHTYGSSTSTATSLSAVKATSFKNLRSTSGTVTFTATWTGPIISLPTITKTGYTCKWTSDGLGDKKGDGTGTWDLTTGTVTARTFTASCTANTYSISYDLDDGTHGSSHPTSATYDTQFTVNNPTKTATATFKFADTVTCKDDSKTCSDGYKKTSDYTFNGWDITEMDGVTHTYGSSTTTDDTIEGTKATKFKNLRATSGTVYFEADWKKPTAITLPKITRDGYTCVWTNNDLSDKKGDGTATWTPSSVKNRTFKASCTKDTYKITLDANGCGTGGSSAVYEKYSTGVYRNSGLTKAMTTSEYPITPPSKSGSEFTGYYTTKSGGTQLIDADGFRKTSNFTKTYFDSNATIYAHCKTHTTHVWRAIGTSTFKTSKWCLGNASPCPSGHSRTYAHSVYCTKCGMSADYYKWNTDNGHVTHPNATTPSRVERKCYNGPSPAGKDGWIRVDDSDLDSWSDVHKHAYGRFGQVDFKDIDGYSCTYSY